MIIDKIDNWHIYFKKPVFAEIFKELSQYTTATTNGVYQGNGDYYFKVMSYDTKKDSTVIESHRKEVDVQILLSGEEHIKVYDAANVVIAHEYDESSDCQFYNPTGNPECEINLKPGYMAIFFPDDIHHPQFAVKEVQTIKKIVIKVNEKLFT